MTLGTLRPCATARCPRLLRRGEQCPEHPKLTAFQRGYNDARYNAWRRAVLERDKQCMMCGAPPQRNDHADHKVPVRSGGARYDIANGQRLCSSCHGGPKQAQDRRLPKEPWSRPIPAPPVFG